MEFKADMEKALSDSRANKVMALTFIHGNNISRNTNSLISVSECFLNPARTTKVYTPF